MTGKPWESSLFALLYTQIACSPQHYASSLCAYPFLRNKLYYVQQQQKKKISLSCKKKKTKRIIYCSLSIVRRLHRRKVTSFCGPQELRNRCNFQLQSKHRTWRQSRKEIPPFCLNATFLVKRCFCWTCGSAPPRRETEVSTHVSS